MTKPGPQRPLRGRQSLVNCQAHGSSRKTLPRPQRLRIRSSGAKNRGDVQCGIRARARDAVYRGPNSTCCHGCLSVVGISAPAVPA
eukprot:351058-Chlamydomonas_euryale.AAC.2